MNILLTNDDGVFAQGIYKLCKELEKDHNVTIVAPIEENSAKSHAITIYEELEVRKVELKGIKSKAYSVTGTPADCVRIALDQLLKDEKIDLVVSGINRGVNLGMDVLYSGTVSAAIEGNIQKLPAIAVSSEVKNGKCHFDTAAKSTGILINEVLKLKKLTSSLLLNLNVPYMEDDIINGVKFCELGEVVYDYFKINSETEDCLTYKIIGREEKDFKEGTDRYYIEKGYATLTPLEYNMTDYELLEKMKKLDIEDKF